MSQVVNRCGQCHDPTDANLCHNCATALRIELGDVPALLTDLDITRSRQDQLTARYGYTGEGSDENPLPYKPHVAEVVWVLHHTLHAWVTTLDGAAPNSTTSALARHLRLHVNSIRVRVDAHELADEITSAIHQARHAIDRPTDDRQFLGPCGAPLGQPGSTTWSGITCRQEIYGVAWKTTTKCPTCGTTHNIAARQQWLLEIAQDRLGTSTVIAGFLRTAGMRCTPGQIRGYVARGRLKPASDTTPPLYRMRDVLAAIEDRYRHRNRQVS